jgi:hypothetical protein
MREDEEAQQEQEREEQCDGCEGHGACAGFLLPMH